MMGWQAGNQRQLFYLERRIPASRGSRFRSYVRLILLLESSGTEALLKFGCWPPVHLTRPKHLLVMVLPRLSGIHLADKISRSGYSRTTAVQHRQLMG